MPDAGLLSTLVKLANVGASGVAIFAIFWIGWLLQKSDATKNPERQHTIRYYMCFCFAIIAILIVPIFLTSGNDSLQKKLAECNAKSQIYTVKGVVQKEDGTSPRNILITSGYPPSTPDGSGRIHFKVQRDIDDKLPVLGFTANDYSYSVSLEDFQITDGNVIDIGTVPLQRLPPE